MDRLTWNVPSWTISCEFFAYLLFAAVILSRIAQTRLFLPVLGVGSLLVYGVLAAIWGTLDLTYNWGFLRCIAGFSLGMLILHLAKDFRSEDWRSWIARGEVAAAALIVVVLAAVSGAWIALSIPLFLVLIALLQFEAGPVSRFLMSRPVQFAGRVSYSIYMVQFFIILCCSIAAKRLLHVPVVIDPHTQKPTFDIDPWAGDLLALMVIALVLATAAMTYRFIEEPARLFGRRLG
jgi:peptidoglycan/LPS O-acetylase OafA/YrhL